MPKRLTVVTVSGEQIVDIPDDLLVLNRNNHFVVPEKADYINLYPEQLVHQYTPFVPDDAPIDITLSSGYIVKVANVQNVAELEEHDVDPVTSTKPTGYCVCGSLGNPPTKLLFVKVYIVEELV